jgi:hypothetical protein
MTYKVNVRGISKLKKKLAKQVEEAGTNAVNATKVELLASLRNETPVDTGEARDGWRITPKGIVNEVEHISDLNDGSSQQAGAFFVERAVLMSPLAKAKGAIIKYK